MMMILVMVMVMVVMVMMMMVMMMMLLLLLLLLLMMMIMMMMMFCWCCWCCCCCCISPYIVWYIIVISKLFASNGITHDIIHLCITLLNWPAAQAGGYPGILEVRNAIESYFSDWNLSSEKSILVGGFNPSEKYESVGMIIPNIWKNKCLKPTRFSTCLKDVSH